MSNIKLFADEQGSDLGGEEKVQSVSKQDSAPKIMSSVSLDPAVADSSSLSPARSVATVPTNLQLESTSTSNCTAKEVQKSTPVTSPRAASKIPTPLPRKTIGAKSSPTSSTSSLSPPTSPSSPKTPSLKSRTANAKSPTGQSSSSPQFPKASEIPIPVNVSSTNTSIPVVSSNLESQQSHPLNTSSKHISHPTFSTKHQVAVGEEALPAERRRTVVEICEKVVVPQGKIPTTPPVTPFITVDRVNEKQSSPTEVRNHDQQSSTPLRKS